MASGGLFTKLRIFLMFVVLAFVALTAWQTRLRTTDWDQPLWVVIYPINPEYAPRVETYVYRLSAPQFEPIEQFVSREAERYGVALERPVDIKLGPVLRDQPPAPPSDRGMLATAWWSLRFRYWAWRTTARAGGPPADIQLFVRYFDPRDRARLGHSLGLQKGLIGIVNAFADRELANRNYVVMTHELLHTLGATDKYDQRTNQPLYPDGYAEPQRTPRHPQARAEIMAGRIPVSPDRAVIPNDLSAVVVGPATAREINWLP